MAVIKELRGVCNRELTSEADFEHRWGKDQQVPHRRFAPVRNDKNF
jgi:hypothetical protein